MRKLRDQGLQVFCSCVQLVHKLLGCLVGRQIDVSVFSAEALNKEEEEKEETIFLVAFFLFFFAVCFTEKWP